MKERLKKGDKQHVFTSVSEAAAYITGDPHIKDEIDAEFAKCAIVMEMLFARTNAKLSQEQIAEKMGVSQSTISRIECGTDEDLTVYEMEKWFAACGMSVRFEIDAANAPGYSHAELLKAEVHRVDARMKALEVLAKQMHASEEIMRHFESFRSGALFNLLALADPPRVEQRITGMAAEPKAKYKIKRGRKKE